jgi:hypothetical protein
MSTTKLTSIVATAAIALLAACSYDSGSGVITDPPTGVPSALLTVVFPSHPADTLRVIVTDSVTITRAEAFVQSGTGPHMLTGKIARGAGADQKYPFHYISESVRLADVGMEICDGAPMRTTQDVDNFFVWATGSVASTEATWCPWESKPIAVIRLPYP